MPDYSSIPLSGQHRGPENTPSTGTEVRAPEAPAPGASSHDDPTYQLVRVEGEGRYRLRAWDEAASGDEDDYEEVARFKGAEMAAALQKLGTGPRFVVLENSQTGSVQLQRESEISASWTDGGRFDQVWFFDDESEAAAYAASRQG